MTDPQTPAEAVVTASRLVHAPVEIVFELIADPAHQPRWDGNDNLSHADEGQRVHAVGDVFVMHNSSREPGKPGKVKENHVVAFEEGRTIAWAPADAGQEPTGHVWRWDLEPADDGTLVTHIYDYSKQTHEGRIEYGRNLKPEALLASIDRLAAAAEAGSGSTEG
ncbi:SRPBCC family protein [Aestuariimicrobium soli]|uniref:SRPBCC family protein n=1 Tax=Aestuariimicrobium soli TaxID=2035834 RepID=UPI003EB9CC6B